MKEKIYEIVVYVAPLVAGFITSVVIPFVIQRFTKKYLTKKIDEVNSGTQIEAINKKLARIEKELLEMRGKTK